MRFEADYAIFLSAHTCQCMQNRAQSIAVMGNNTPKKGQDKTTGMKLKDLEKLLGKNVNLFPGEHACRANSLIITVQYLSN